MFQNDKNPSLAPNTYYLSFKQHTVLIESLWILNYYYNWLELKFHNYRAPFEYPDIKYG